MILVVGDPNDLSAAYVGWLADRRHLEVVILPESRLGLDWWFGAVEESGETEIVQRDRGPLPMRQISGAFVRLNPEPAVPDELGIVAEVQYLYVQERRAALQYLLDRLPFPVVNPSSAGRSNGSKPFQMARLSGLGFDVPRWIATNEAVVAEAFVASCPDGAIVKSCSGLRSHVRRATADLIEQLEVSTAPVLLQNYVVGHDVRVHVVAGSTFSTSVSSDAVDYRFDSESVAYRPIEVPSDFGVRCARAAANEGLLLAGFDFRIDPSGAWWCLEMNPVPTFLPYEAGSGHSIGDAVVDLIAPESQAPHPTSPLADRLRAAFEDAARN